MWQCASTPPGKMSRPRAWMIRGASSGFGNSDNLASRNSDIGQEGLFCSDDFSAPHDNVELWVGRHDVGSPLLRQNPRWLTSRNSIRLRESPRARLLYHDARSLAQRGFERFGALAQCHHPRAGLSAVFGVVRSFIGVNLERSTANSAQCPGDA
jgi:hypothetical protein